MRHGFVKVAAVTPRLRVADVTYNVEEICRNMKEAWQKGAKITVFPELCVTGYTCGDLFAQDLLLKKAEEGLKKIAGASVELDGLFFVGLPLEKNGKLYNVAAAVNRGKILGFVTKSFLPNYGEFYEMRQFTPGPEKAETILFDGVEIPFGPQMIFEEEKMKELKVSAELCEDLWSVESPGAKAVQKGAVILANLSASNELLGKAKYRRDLVKMHTSRLVCGYIYANAGEEESTTDLVFSGHNILAENGAILKESPVFSGEITISEIDIKRILGERRKNTSFRQEREEGVGIPFSLDFEETKLTRFFSPTPFIPVENERGNACEEILTIQAKGLQKRLAHCGKESAVVGISGGLDSTLALLVTVKAFDFLGWSRKGITAITMPCFGTTDRTYQNACKMARELGVTLREIPIKEAVLQHFTDIGQDEKDHSVTYENAQARERTQVLMDVANRMGGIVVGTGDLSELVLGWATYNGDHMSMYGVNGSVPKTVVRYLVAHYTNTCDDETLRSTLSDVLDTPVSPELLPPKEGEIAQKTEDLVGPYELHDFFLYYTLRFGYEPGKILRLALRAFSGRYEEDVIYKWETVFFRRFFTQQFKRSCLPDGPKVGTVAVSPRGDLRMPSDAGSGIWLEDLEEEWNRIHSR